MDKKQAIINALMYAAVGLVLGLVAGFLTANWVRAGMPGTSASSRSGGQPGPASVNTGRQPELPADHPDIGQAGSAPASELPPDHPDISGGGQPTAGTGSVELPSLDPLPPNSKEKRVEQEYKNIRMLKGLPADRLQSIMNSFKASLGVDCTYCHVQNEWHLDQKPAKKVAREMIQLTRDSNAKGTKVTCFTCHRGQPVPQS